jgi:hypothetical protein
MNFTPNAVLVAEERAQAEIQANALTMAPYVSGLVSESKSLWQVALDAKRPIEQAMIENLQRRNGVYPIDKLNEIKKLGGSEIFMMLTDEKCSAVEAMIEDTYRADHEGLPFGVSSTPVPDLNDAQRAAIEQAVHMESIQNQELGVAFTPDQISQSVTAMQLQVQERMQQLARDREQAIEDYVKDVIVESNWQEALREFISDLVTFKAAFMIGPTVRTEKALVWDEYGRPQVAEKVKLDFECASPFDIYPSPSSKDVDDGPLFRKMTLTRSKLYDMMRMDGFNAEAIKGVLSQYGQGGLRDWLYINYESQRRQLEGRHNEIQDPEGKIDALRIWRKVQGLRLLEHGVPIESVPDIWAEYDAEIWLVGNYVIKCVLNSDPIGRIPVYKSSFRKRNGSFWGDGVPDLIKDQQDACNAAARSIVNNMAIGSGPQIGVDHGSMHPGADYSSYYPWKVWHFDMKNAATGRPPVWFFQPNIHTDQLLKVYEFFSREADNKSGVPKYGYGAEAKGGALGTATGFSMMMSNVSKGIKRVVANIDNDVIAKSVERVYHWLLLYDQNPVLMTGDICFVARGSTALIAKEQQQVRRNEFLQVALQPAVLNIIGMHGLASILRKVSQGLDFDASDIVPSREVLLRQQAIQQMAMGAGGMPVGAQMAGVLPMQQPQPAQPASQPRPQPTNPAGDRASGMDARAFSV